LEGAGSTPSGALALGVPATKAGDTQISKGDAPQKFSSVNAAFDNPVNQNRHLISRDHYKIQRSAALAEWKLLSA
jgi:hypothetical protein